MIEYEGSMFRVCGERIPPVRENPADFLAGKKGTEQEGESQKSAAPGEREIGSGNNGGESEGA